MSGILLRTTTIRGIGIAIPLLQCHIQYLFLLVHSLACTLLASSGSSYNDGVMRNWRPLRTETYGRLTRGRSRESEARERQCLSWTVSLLSQSPEMSQIMAIPPT
jgi:hypothetical protein